jgi:hypothetical protein
VAPGIFWKYACTGSTCSVEQGSLTLTKMQRFGVEAEESLPALEFGYTGNHLTWAENGYGGRVEFDYEEDGNQPWYETTGEETETQNCQELSFAGWSNALCDNNSPTGRLYPYAGFTSSVNDSLMPVFQPSGAYRIEATAYAATGARSPSASTTVWLLRS